MCLEFRSAISRLELKSLFVLKWQFPLSSRPMWLLYCVFTLLTCNTVIKLVEYILQNIVVVSSWFKFKYFEFKIREIASRRLVMQNAHTPVFSLVSMQVTFCLFHTSVLLQRCTFINMMLPITVCFDNIKNMYNCTMCLPSVLTCYSVKLSRTGTYDHIFGLDRCKTLTCISIYMFFFQSYRSR